VDTTPVLGLPLMGEGQGGSSTIYNEAMQILDTSTGGGGSGTPGGSTGQVQYKSAGTAFFGTSGLVVDATRVTSLTLATPLPVAQGGTGADNPGTAQTNLQLVPGVHVQAYDAELAALAALTSASDRVPYFIGAGSAALAVFTSAGRALLDDPDASAQRLTLGLKALALLDTLSTPYLDNSAVTYAKIQNLSAPLKILGRYSAGTGPTQELTLGSGLSVDGAGVITAAGGGGSYTDEQAQDAVGAMLVDSPTIDLTYTDATPSLTASVIDGSITEAKLGLTDVTTSNASTTAHGLLRKLSGTATEYLNGAGSWTIPAGGGGESYWIRGGASSTLVAPFTAFWSLEEASGDRLDRLGSLALTPVGGASLTQGVGRIGQAVAINGTPGTYLTMASAPAITMTTATSLTVCAWFYLTARTSCAYVSKGNAGANASYEYLLGLDGSQKFQVAIANGSAAQALSDTGAVPTLNAWHLVIGWFDAVANTLNLQVDNGAVVSVAATVTSYASAHALEIGRWAGWVSSPSLTGRVDMVGIGKRVLTEIERAQLWNGGAGLEYPFTITPAPYLTPQTAGDALLLASSSLTTERLEVDTGIKLGNSTGTVDGIVRWTGTDLEVRKGGAWVSLTT
jgi:Concanavalin A-like lectin/glucanases superfamily